MCNSPSYSYIPFPGIEQSSSYMNENNRLEDQQYSSSSSTGSNAGRLNGNGASSHYMISSAPGLDFDSMTEVVIEDITELEPTSAILDFCKRKFLQPYVHLLGFVGLRPMTVDTSCCQVYLSHIQTFLIFTLLCIGYFLQFFADFRRDRGFSQSLAVKLNNVVYKQAFDIGEMLFVYIVPSLIHLSGFISAIYVFRIADNEQLQNLVERVYLMSNAPRRLCITLWLYVICGIVWLIFLTAYVILLATAQSDALQIEWFGKPSSKVQYMLKIFLILTIFIHDLVQMIVLTSYCIECYLLRLHLYNLKEKLVQHTIATLDWMREVLEFRKLLQHLNRKVATPICFFTVMNLSNAFAGLVYLFKEYDFNNGPIKVFMLSIANFFMWLIIGLVPFFQAASVTRACRSTQASGHQIRVRPFVYHNTAAEDLDSTLMFASSLHMSAKLYKMPIQANYLCFTILIISIGILTLGMCLNVSLGFV